jgi:hypothetical protein
MAIQDGTEAAQGMERQRKPAFRASALVFVLVVLVAGFALWTFSMGVTLASYPEASEKTIHKGSGVTIDASNAKEGYVMVKASRKKRLKLRIAKGGRNYTYDLNREGRYEVFPLQMESGAYSLTVFEQVRANQYAQVYSKKMTVQLDDEYGYALYPNQYVYYDADYQAVDKAAQLCEGLANDREITEAIIDFVSGTVLYDHIKAKTVETGYLPNPDETLEEKKGICFDYAALVACMLRTQGVRCKLVIGYADSYYHAWNEVLLDEKWTRYDTTSMASGLKVVSYTTERVY